MKNVTGFLLALLLAASCSTRTPTTAGPTTTAARVITTTTTIAVDWLERIRAANVQKGTVTITAVQITADVMRIGTDLGDAPDDPVRKGMATQVCFDAQAAGWSGYIEVRSNSDRVLAWDGTALHRGCRGR